VDSALRKIAIGGGVPLTLCQVDAPWGATWHDDTIFVASGTQGLLRVPADGGEPEVVVKIGPDEAVDGPQVLDDGRLLLYALATGTGSDRWDRAQIIGHSLISGQRHVIVRGGSAARYLPTPRATGSGGYLVYTVGNSLLAVPFDVTRVELRGYPAPILEPVARSANSAQQSGVAQYAVSATGMLAYLSGRSVGASLPKVLAFAGRDGKVQMLGLPPHPYIHPRLSPDGRQLVVGTDDGREANVWIYDLKSGGSLRRLTFGGRNQYPIWTPDGRFITFQSDRDGDEAVFRQLADGSGPAQRVTKPEAGVGHRPESWSPDGKTLAMNVVRTGDQSIWTISTEPGAQPTVFAHTAADEKHSTFSPDGRWVAHMSTTEGASDIYVQPFPPTGAKYQVATGGRTPAWSPDGKQLFFHAVALNRFVVVDMRAQQGLTWGTPVPLPIEDAIHPLAQRNYDVSADGKQLLVVLPAQTSQAASGRRASVHLNIVLNWFEELARVAPPR
jgi:eukaryotic-like serine/threonine-protein kinase